MLRCAYTLAWIALLAALLGAAPGGERRQGDWRFASPETEALAFLLVLLWAAALRFTLLDSSPPPPP